MSGLLIRRLVQFSRSPSQVVRESIGGAIQEAQAGVAEQEVAAAASASASIPVNDNEKAEIRHLSRVDFEEGIRYGARGVNARFEIWKRQWVEASKSTTQSLSSFTDDGGQEANYELRFLVTQMSMPRRERFSVMRTFGEDPNFLMTFGQEPKIWSISGMLPRGPIALPKADWYRSFTRFYDEHLRADLMVARNEFAVFLVGRTLLEGYVLSFEPNLDSQMDDAGVPFTMTMFVRKARFLDDVVRGVGGVDDTGVSSTPPSTLRAPGRQWDFDLSRTIVNISTEGNGTADDASVRAGGDPSTPGEAVFEPTRVQLPPEDLTPLPPIVPAR